MFRLPEVVEQASTRACHVSPHLEAGKPQAPNLATRRTWPETERTPKPISHVRMLNLSPVNGATQPNNIYLLLTLG